MSYAEPNWIRHPSEPAIPNDDLFGQLWGLDNTGQLLMGQDPEVSRTADADIDAPEAWELQPGWGSATGDAPVVVAVMDTGIDLSHPDLAENLWTNTGETPDNQVDDDGNGYVDDVNGYDFVGDDPASPVDDPVPNDQDGHGTHVAGTIAAGGNNGEGVVGVAPSSSLMVLKVCAPDVQGIATCPLDAILRAYAYAIDNGARVLNGSLGGPEFDSAEVSLLSAHPEVLFVFAAGNDSANVDNERTYPCALDERPGYDAGSDNLICVAATNQNDTLAGFSNYGLESVDLGAPGVWILSTYPEYLVDLTTYLPYGYLSGTSMAAPHVAGAAALLAQDPAVDAAQVKQKLLSTVDPVATLTGKTVSGGRLSLARAVGGEPGDPPTPEPPVEPDPEPDPQPVPVPGQPDTGGGSEQHEPSGNGSQTSRTSGDGTAPRTRFARNPRRVVRTPWRFQRVFFAFRSNERGVDFLCNFDRRPTRRCGPRFLRWFRAGRHVLRVSARDRAGNVDRTPAIFRFVVRRVRRR